jgi:hypothetical protein
MFERFVGMTNVVRIRYTTDVPGNKVKEPDDLFKVQVNKIVG